MSSPSHCGVLLNSSGGNEPCSTHLKPLHNVDEDNFTCRWAFDPLATSPHREALVWRNYVTSPGG